MYQVLQVVAALVPPEIRDAIPMQLQQLAPRAPPQPTVIDVQPYNAAPESSAALTAANSPETLLANQLGELAAPRLAAESIRRPLVSQERSVQPCSSDSNAAATTSHIMPPAAAEVATLRTAVTAVREAAMELQAAADPAQQPMLRLNLREARDILARRLEQLSPQCSGGVGVQAASEATLLLVELDALL